MPILPRWSPALLVVLTACSANGVSGPQSGVTVRRTLLVDDEPRSYWYAVPEGVEPTGAGIVLAFHGAGGSGEGLLLGTDLNRVGAEVNAVVAYPDADQFNWAEDCGCTQADLTHSIGDTAFVTAMAQDLAAEIGASPARLYAVGFSQGGMFAQRLACQMPERFEAIAVVAATMSVPLAESCAPSVPVNIFLMVSTVDPVFPWEGSAPGPLATLGGPETVELWHGLNGCTDVPEAEEANRLIRQSASQCDGGVAVELLGTVGGVHAWFMTAWADTGDEVARFFGG